MLRNAKAIVGSTLLVATVWWLCEVGAAGLARGGGVLVDGWRGLLAGLFLSAVAALVGGTLLGGLVALSLGRRPLGQAISALQSRARRWLGGADAAPERAADLLAAAFVLATGAAGSFLILEAAVGAFARATSVAGVGALAHLGLLGVGALLFVALRRPFRAAAVRLAPVRAVGWPLRAPWRLTAVLLAAGATGVAAAAARHRGVVEYLPWERAATAGAALALGSAALWGLAQVRRPGRAVQLGLTLGMSGLWLASGALSVTLPHRAPAARVLLEDDLLAARPGLLLVSWATDADADGFRAVFGGGDCAPFDPRIHPAATDIPDNRVDEDCDGRDLTVDDLVQAGGLERHEVPAEVPRRPHILLVTIDAFAARHMGVLGYERQVTENLDQLATEGVLFEHCFAQGPSTRLSLPSMMTSRYDSEVARVPKRSNKHELLSKNRMLAEILGDAGYETAAVVPISYFTRWKGLLQGFDRVDDSPAETYHARKKPHPGAGVVRAAQEELEREHSKPLFLWTHFYDAHPPHAQPEDEGTPDFGTEKRDRYDAELHHVDAHVGRLVRRARRVLGENLVVIVTSDHGAGFDLPRYRRHQYGYDLNTITLHVPLIVAAPFLEPRRVERLCNLLDLTPTLVDLLRIEGEFDFRGSSLVPELFGTYESRPQILFHEMYLTERVARNRMALLRVSIRTPMYNLVLDREKGRAQLWRWDDDYEETVDLIASDEPEVAKQRDLLRTALSAFIYKQVGDDSSKAGDPAKKEAGDPAKKEAGDPAKKEASEHAER